MSFGIVCNAHSNLCIIFVIAGSFDEIYKKRVDSAHFATEIKRTERNKQFVMSESTKVTKNESEKARASAELFPEWETSTLFFIFKLLTISVPSKMNKYLF